MVGMAGLEHGLLQGQWVDGPWDARVGDFYLGLGCIRWPVRIISEYNENYFLKSPSS